MSVVIRNQHQQAPPTVQIGPAPTVSTNTAHEELLRSVASQLERLARKMLRRFPGVQHCVQTDEVLQNSLLRLLRALREVQPTSMRDFFGLAAVQMRRELIDLARHFESLSQTTNLFDLPTITGSASPPLWNPGADSVAQQDLERWSSFHQEVENLPVEEREVVSLIFYHGWKHQDIADRFDVCVQTVQRRWQRAMIELHDLLARVE